MFCDYHIEVMTFLHAVYFHPDFTLQNVDLSKLAIKMDIHVACKIFMCLNWLYCYYWAVWMYLKMLFNSVTINFNILVKSI